MLLIIRYNDSDGVSAINFSEKFIKYSFNLEGDYLDVLGDEKFKNIKDLNIDLPRVFKRNQKNIKKTIVKEKNHYRFIIKSIISRFLLSTPKQFYHC